MAILFNSASLEHDHNKTDDLSTGRIKLLNILIKEQETTKRTISKVNLV